MGEEEKWEGGELELESEEVECWEEEREDVDGWEGREEMEG